MTTASSANKPFLISETLPRSSAAVLLILHPARLLKRRGPPDYHSLHREKSFVSSSPKGVHHDTGSDRTRQKRCSDRSGRRRDGLPAGGDGESERAGARVPRASHVVRHAGLQRHLA